MRDATVVQSLIRRLPRGRRPAATLLGHLMRGQTRGVVHGATFRLDLREYIQCRMYLGAYEPVETRWVQQYLQAGDCCVDVGASFGYYTALMAQCVGPTGRVFAFEPSPVAAPVLACAIAESDLRQVRLTHAAVGDRAGVLPLYLESPYNVAHSPSLAAPEGSRRAVEVPVITLDSFAPLADWPIITLLKVDVEGYEPNVLRGMTALLAARRVRYVLCEFHEWWLQQNGATPDELHLLLTAAGFEVTHATAMVDVWIDGVSYTLQDRWYTHRDA